MLRSLRRFMPRLGLAAALSGLVLAACSQAPRPPLCQVSAQQSVVPGQYIVRLTGLHAASVRSLQVGGASLRAVRPLGADGTALFAADSAADPQLVLAGLRARPDVVFAQPNHRLRAALAPNDPHYLPTSTPNQWNLHMIGSEAAWDGTTGSAGTTVAVLDTGILADGSNSTRTHPELLGRAVAGYDFVSDARCSGDGDGRDVDAFDPGGDVETTVAGSVQYSSSYHGTNVAGIIAANTGNAQGIAGLDWAARVLPVRVLGTGGGTEADVIDGLHWAVGASVVGVAQNTEFRARVVNLSLGGDGPCPKALQAAISTVVNEHGAIVVVAAGNGSGSSSSGVDAANTFPANCEGVVAVGAVRSDGRLARYSNYGSVLALVAPGGGDSGRPVLSLARNDSSGGFTLAQTAGTSMAAPHVSGVISLMLARNPELSGPQIVQILRNSATDMTGKCANAAGQTVSCGAGLLNAGGAVQAVPLPPAP